MIIDGGIEVILGFNKSYILNVLFFYDFEVGLGDYIGMNFIWFFGVIKGNFMSNEDFFIVFEDVVIEY